MTNKGTLPPPTMDWNTANPWCAFEKFRDLTEFLFKDQKISKRASTKHSLPDGMHKNQDLEVLHLEKQH